MALHATYLGANGWLLEFGALRVLVDPWLTGPLEFPPGPWFFRGELPQERPAPLPVDLLVLTQGLPDHCHPASLALLPPTTPVVGSPAAVARARALGFTQLTALAHGESHCHEQLRLTASQGAPVPQPENGYLFDHPGGRLYLEPHGFLDPSLPEQPLDAVITPVVDLGLPLVGAFVKGQQVLPQLVERFKPLTVLVSTTGGDVRFEGALNRLLWLSGSLQAAAAMLPEGCRLIDSRAGERYSLEQRQPAAAVAHAGGASSGTAAS
jgi:L-ascorbate metabolism protein UlaG (beta-lactamase superfamily)